MGELDDLGHKTRLSPRLAFLKVQKRRNDAFEHDSRAA